MSEKSCVHQYTDQYHGYVILLLRAANSGFAPMDMTSAIATVGSFVMHDDPCCFRVLFVVSGQVEVAHATVDQDCHEISMCVY